MSTIIDFNNLREKRIQDVEGKASEDYGAIKIGEDSYIIPSNVVRTSEIDMAFKDNVDMCLDERLIEQIKVLKVSDGDYISISCKEILEDNYKLLEAFIISEEEVYELMVKGDLLYNQREMLLNMIAYYHKEKEVYITFYLHYNFELLEKLISE